MKHDPILVNIIRGNRIESFHNVIAITIEPNGQIIDSYGDIEQKIYPRSSIKPIQALPLILSGAHQKFQLTTQELAIACSSHNAEKIHTDCVETWLKKINLNITDLECGAYNPSDPEALNQLIKSGQACSSLHNNCSGKHTGMLCTCLQMGFSTQNYVHVNHPVQLFVKQVIEKLSEYKIPQQDYGIDGCSLPNWSLQLKNFAVALAKFANPQIIPELEYQNACELIYNACLKHPELIAGTNRYCTLMMTELNKKAVIKTGAEGVMAAIIRSPKPMAIAVKCLDGATRAAESAMTHLLFKYGVLKNANSPLLNKKIMNWNKIETGFIETKIP